MGSVFYNNKKYLDSTLGGNDDSVGLIVPSVTPLEGWLECNGEEYDTERYPVLYELLQSDKLPDFREAVPVGIGLNPNTEKHLELSLGVFQESAIEDHTHTNQVDTAVAVYETYSGSGLRSFWKSRRTSNLSTVGDGPSRGKRKGVRYFIYPGV